MADTNYTVRFPLTFEESSEPGYDGIGSADLNELVIFNMSNVLLTMKGERVFDINFGVGLHQYLFENTDDNSWIESLKNDIAAQIDEYVPSVNVNNIQVETNVGELALYVAISYTIAQINVQDVLEIGLDQTGNFNRFGSGFRATTGWEVSSETKQALMDARVLSTSR